MSVQATKRFIEEQAHEAYQAIWQQLDCEIDIDSETAAKAAHAAEQAVRNVLHAELNCVGLAECYAESGR